MTSILLRSRRSLPSVPGTLLILIADDLLLPSKRSLTKICTPRVPARQPVID
ncbi:hypothetical protein LINPERHAP1_LOCUS3735, partial [Linum perenne]